MSDKTLKQAIVEMRISEIGNLVQSALNNGLSPFVILNELRSGLVTVGKHFEEQTCFLSDLIMAAETMKEALVVLRPHLTLEQSRQEGRVLIGTIMGDVHDLGKSIVTTLLSARGFEVIDLGVDVEPKRFAQEALGKDVDVVGISALLSTTQPLSKEVVRAVQDSGLRGKVKTILGGAATQRSAPEQYGVDAAVTDAVEGISIIEGWTEAKRKRRN